MRLKIKNKIYNVKYITKFWERFKCLKFVFEPLDYVIKFPKRKKCNTYFFVQKIDIVLTDKNDVILHLYENVKTEVKIRRRWKVYNTYFMPLGSCKELKVGEKLNFIKEKE